MMGRVKGIGVQRKRSYLKRNNSRKCSLSSSSRKTLNNVTIASEENLKADTPTSSERFSDVRNVMEPNPDDSPYHCTRSKTSKRLIMNRRTVVNHSPSNYSNCTSFATSTIMNDPKKGIDELSCSSKDVNSQSYSPNKLKTPDNAQINSSDDESPNKLKNPDNANTNSSDDDSNSPIRNIIVKNNINYNEKCSHGITSKGRYSNNKPPRKVMVRNTINCRREVSFPKSDRADDEDDASNSNVFITNTINYNEESLDRPIVCARSSNVHENNKKKELTKYVQRRRAVNGLKTIFKNFGDFNCQVDLLTTFLNESDMQPVLDAANILSPKTILLNKHLVDQMIKIVRRCSVKESCRGRLSHDQDSFRTNLVAAMVSSPNADPRDVPIKKNQILQMLFSNTELSKSSCRRLIEKAGKRRSALSVQETVSSWSVITHRHGYNTKQSRLNVELLEWILNHHHVIRSPDETVSLRVPLPNGGTVFERVAKLWLEVSVRELHQDMMKPPPIGFSGAYCKDDPKKLIISERYLRNILPPQLRTMSFSDKQLCGCACCTIMKIMHECLLKFRSKIFLMKTPSRSVTTRKEKSNNLSIDRYKSEVMTNDCHNFPHARDVLPTITCRYVSDQNLPKWNCVMGRCVKCPDVFIPDFESEPDNDFDITYGNYVYNLKCKVHGVLEGDVTVCSKCVASVKKGILESEERLTRRKEMTFLKTKIMEFHQNVYAPYLKRYKYHIALVTLLSKNYCKKMRIDAFMKNKTWLLSEMDYAERLAKQLNFEIQSDHFEDNATLSIEGCTLQYHISNNELSTRATQSSTHLDFHSHFADYSRQDAATTFDHMNAMFKSHISRHCVSGKLPDSCVMLDHTDGCAKQYRSANALYLLNVFAMSQQIIIDRAICAPGHGKSIIDGLNAVDKHYLKRVMLISGNSKNDDDDARMRMDSSISFAKECARLCSLPKRKDGVMSKKISKRFYHVHKFDEITYPTLSKGTIGWNQKIKEKGNGILHHYNFRADPKLGYECIAVRRIPCACDACLNQMKQSWLRNKSFHEQPRYMSNNKNCVLWNVMGELNNWKLISIIDTKCTSSNKSSQITKNVFKTTLQSRAQAMASLIVQGNLGAIATSDAKAMSGYYVFTFRSCPYILQESQFNGSDTIAANELVCDITWLYPACTWLQFNVLSW